ncbi:MAG TPA: TetR/AcrR family transcriptional regulator [Acidimicrobiales bacterium]|nr:TetR/AcrR family transcriptional regulator [Acidimicrobiales bacterium]
MIGTVTARREEKVAEIVGRAWELARSEGFRGLSLRALAARVGMRQPSLYEYFESKDALYDAMFGDANRQLLERLDALALPSDPRKALKSFMGTFTAFALEDCVRAQLLFERPIPGFTPTQASYQHAEAVLERVFELLRAAGLTDPGDVDCFVAMVGGIIAAQSSNDPGGNRWSRHLHRMIDLHLDNARPRRNSK